MFLFNRIPKHWFWESGLFQNALRAHIYLLKVKLTIKTPERRQWLRSDVLIANFEHTSHLFLVSLLLSFVCWALDMLEKIVSN